MWTFRASPGGRAVPRRGRAQEAEPHPSARKPTGGSWTGLGLGPPGEHLRSFSHLAGSELQMEKWSGGQLL